MNKRQIVAAAKKIVRLRAAAKRLYQAAEEIETDVIDHLLEREGWEHGPVRLIDRFADRNVVYKPAGVRRFEVEVTE